MEETILTIFESLNTDEKSKKLLQLISKSLADPNYDFEDIIDQFIESEK